MPLASQTGNHCIVCGDGPLAYRIGEELTSRYGADVVLVVPERLRSSESQISTPAGATVLERDELSSETFTEAGVASARALALVGQDDLANFHAALRAQELNPELRLVVAAFNRRLGEHIRGFFRDCTVLSSSSMAAPSFVAAALGSPAPSHVRVSGRTLYLAKRSDVPPEQVVCGLAVPDDPAGTTQLIAPDELAGGDDQAQVRVELLSAQRGVEVGQIILPHQGEGTGRRHARLGERLTGQVVPLEHGRSGGRAHLRPVAPQSLGQHQDHILAVARRQFLADSVGERAVPADNAVVPGLDGQGHGQIIFKPARYY